MDIIPEIFGFRSRERLKGKAIFITPCGQKNPIELYFRPEGYFIERNPILCRKCRRQATYKMLFLSPKSEVEGDFGPAYFCQNCVPDINTVASNKNQYYGLLYEGRT